MSKVWVSYGTSESSDHYGPFVFASKPTEKQLEKFWRENGDYFPDEPGPGSYGTYVYVTTEQVTVLDPKTGKTKE